MPRKTRIYNCILCKKEYASSGSLWFHNNKYHNIDVSKSIPNDKNDVSKSISNDSLLTTNNNLIIQNDNLSKYNCKYCNKFFSTKQNKWKHENNVCKNKTDILQENIKLKQELETIKNNNQIIPLNNSNHSYNTNTNNSNNTNNGNINNGVINANNNTVTINKIGTEPIVFRTKDIKMIANDGMNGPITCARKLNFSKNNPSNHSYCVTSLDGEYCKAINHITQQPEMVPKKEIIDQVFESAYRFIESVAAQIKEDACLRKKLSKHEIKEIDRIVANKNKYYEKKNRKIFYNSVNSMSYNYRDLVLSTWKLLKPLEENLITEIESDSDSEIREVTEFPDINESSDEETNENSDNTSDSDSDDDFNLLTAI